MPDRDSDRVGRKNDQPQAGVDGMDQPLWLIEAGAIACGALQIGQCVAQRTTECPDLAEMQQMRKCEAHPGEHAATQRQAQAGRGSPVLGNALYLAMSVSAERRKG